MPLLAESHLPIVAQDITSWCYDNRHSFDQNKPIHVDVATGQSVTATEAWTYVRQLVAGFRAIGLQRGDCVCIHSFNNLYYPLLIHGIVAAGGIFVGTNPSYTPYELEHAIKTSKTKFIIADPEVLNAPVKVAQALGISKQRILLFSDAGDGTHPSWRTLLQHGQEDWVGVNDLETAKNSTAFLMFSSGTTGLPKAAQLSHYNLVAQHTLVYDNPDRYFPFEISMLCPLPFFHVAMAPTVAVSSFRSGLTAHVMRRFEPGAYLDAIRKYSIKRLVMVPPMIIAVLNISLSNPEPVRKSLLSVRSVVAAAAPLDAKTQQRLQVLLPQESQCTQLWAMTETSCVAALFYPPESDLTGSVGRFIPNLDVKLVDDQNNEIGPYGVRGELCVRGPTIIRGYLDNPAANAESWDDDGYFHTGDVVTCNAKTKLWYLVDRKKELIKVRGFQVSPAEIEGVIRSLPNVRDVAVFGVPDKSGHSEAPRAHIVKREGLDISAEEVNRCVGENLANYKQLVGGVKFVDAIPKNASGKILKRMLRDEAKAEMERAAAKL